MRASIRPMLVELDARELPSFFGHNLFPDDSAWNQKITDAPAGIEVVPGSVRAGHQAGGPDPGGRPRGVVAG